MRLLLLLLMVLVMQIVVKAQDSSTLIHITHLPPEGVVLDKGWKFMAGDHPAFANPNFDDSKWQSVDPTKDIHDIPQLWNNKIVWFRLHLIADSTIAREHVAAFIEQTGASEIYLNGQRIGKFGTIASDSKQVKAVSPPQGSFIPFPLNQQREQVLAVRFAVQKGIFYFNFAGRSNPAIVLQVTDLKSISNNIHSDNVVYFEFSRVGLYLILAVMHLALFCFNPSQKANLYFFAYSFINCIINSLSGLAYREVYLVSAKMLMLTGTMLFVNIGYLFLVLAVYKVFHYSKRWILWLLVVAAFANIFLLGTSEESSFWSSSIFAVLPLLEVIRVTILASKEGQRGAKIVIAGAISFILFWVLFTLFALGYIPAGPNWIYGNFAFNISFLSIPIAISIYLALESSYSSRTLTQKLQEVQELSEQTRKQELEKQQILASQKERLEQEVTQRTAELKQSLEGLKATQAQLIQREKMASLGELTAGIAHEIQNPLNFVNNFSEVSTEMMDELKKEANEGNKDEVLDMADDVVNNLQKITYHGKRADAIVKGMLQHSRQSSGKKEPTDINSLAEEYLRLSYQSIRSKDKSFTATITTDFDDSINKVNIVPQDIGRMLLNLFNNAFYAVKQKKQLLNGTYEPTISVSIKRPNDKVEIIIKDNGSGIPKKIVDKVFQPFFTTKPTGEGTGLGLSLSYDIIKAHGGEINVESKEGEGAEFIVQLPLQS